MRLDGKTALVTGAGSGIGKCIAEICAREGARVVPSDIDFDTAKSANAALYPASADAEFLTGNIVEVDGGRCI